MLKILERKITLQLLVFYGLFVIPLLLGGAELYFFQYDVLQQSAQQADLGLAQSISQEVEMQVQGVANEAMALAHNRASIHLDQAQLLSLFSFSKQTRPEISEYTICDPSGKVILNYPSLSEHVGQSFSGSEYFQEVLQKDRPFVLPGHLNLSNGSYNLSVAMPISDEHKPAVGVVVLNLSLHQLNAHLLSVQRQLTGNSEVRIWIIDSTGISIANSVGVAPEHNLLQRIPGLSAALLGKPGNLIAPDERRDWLYSYVSVGNTSWAVIVGRPTDVTFATMISFQHSLIIALVMLLVGASVFWFAMHGWVVAPLSRLAQAAAMIKPDQLVRATDSKLLAREKSRQDEIGRLVNAFSAMEEEIHALFRKSDKQSQTRLQTLDAIMRSMDEGVLLENHEGQVIYANARFMQFVGISAEEVLLDTFQQASLTARLETMIDEPEIYYEAVRGAEYESGAQEIEFRVDGYYNQLGQLVQARRHIRMRFFQVRDMAGKVIGRGKIFNDFTQQNEAELVKKNLLAIVSHELRTPLTAIKGYATSLLETDIEVDLATQRDFLQRIVEEEDRMAELVTSLLEMSQLEAGTLRLVPSYCQLDTLLEQVVATVRGKPLSMHVSLPVNPPVLYIDQRRMEMVLCNLLENVQKYAGERARVEIVARCVWEQEDEGIYLSIADNGPGIEKDLTERIFDRFYQIDGGRERKSNGVGLGLAICRGFVEAHGGRIWAENRQGDSSGAIFFIWLPARLLKVPGANVDPFELGKAL